jgi:hypothetical protein
LTLPPNSLRLPRLEKKTARHYHDIFRAVSDSLLQRFTLLCRVFRVLWARAIELDSGGDRLNLNNRS